MSARWEHVAPILVIAALFITLWRPAPGASARTPEQEGKIVELAALLGTPQSSPADIERRLLSFSQFPPDPTASRALAKALVTCDTTSLGAAQRAGLAQQLYAITTPGDGLADAIPGALAGIQEAAIRTRCAPLVIESLMTAARGVARSDPSRRRDWG
jgi:hypothetical protein